MSWNLCKFLDNLLRVATVPRGHVSRCEEGEGSKAERHGGQWCVITAGSRADEEAARQMNARACVCACLVVRLCDLKHYVGAQCRNGNRQEDQQSLTIRNWKLWQRYASSIAETNCTGCAFACGSTCSQWIRRRSLWWDSPTAASYEWNFVEIIIIFGN